MPLDLSLLPYEIPPVSCFLWRFLMTFLLGRSAFLGVVCSLSPAVFFLRLYYTTALGIRLFADMPTMQRKICAVSSLPLRAKNGIINMLGCCTAQTVRCPFWQGTALFLAALCCGPAGNLMACVRFYNGECLPRAEGAGRCSMPRRGGGWHPAVLRSPRADLNRH